MSHVATLEDNLSGIGNEVGADDVAERSLPGSVGADHGNELAFRNGQVDVIDGMRVAEIFLQVDRLQEGHFVRLPSFIASCAVVPTMPAGSAMTRTTSTTPSRSCQYSVLAIAYVFR